jgi:hypothetical protein
MSPCLSNSPTVLLSWFLPSLAPSGLCHTLDVLSADPTFCVLFQNLDFAASLPSPSKPVVILLKAFPVGKTVPEVPGEACVSLWEVPFLHTEQLSASAQLLQS